MKVLEAGPGKVVPIFYAPRRLSNRRKWRRAAWIWAPTFAFISTAKSDGFTGKLLAQNGITWSSLHTRKDDLNSTDIYTLRRIMPEDRGKKLVKEKPQSRRPNLTSFCDYWVRSDRTKGLNSVAAGFSCLVACDLEFNRAQELVGSSPRKRTPRPQI